MESSKGVFCVIDKAVRSDVACVQFSHVKRTKVELLGGLSNILLDYICTISSPRLSSQKKPYLEHQGTILASLATSRTKIWNIESFDESPNLIRSRQS